MLLNAKAYSVTTVIKTIWYWWGDKHTDQWKRKEDQEIDPQKIFSTDVWKKCKSNSMIAFSINGSWAIRHQ